MEDDDQEILRMAIDLCRQVRLSKRFDPQTIGWSQTVPWDTPFFSAGVRKRTQLLLPVALKTKLELFQWKPCLAYSFLGMKSASWLLRYFLLIFFLPIVAFAFATGFVGFVFGASIANIFGSVSLIVVILLSFITFLRRIKKRLLRLVGEAAKLGGRDAMLSALEKIDSIGIWEVESGKKRHGLIASLWPYPSILERMEYLRTLG